MVGEGGGQRERHSTRESKRQKKASSIWKSQVQQSTALSPPRRRASARPPSLTGSPQGARSGVRGHRAARGHGRRGGGNGGAEGRGHFLFFQSKKGERR